MILCYFDVFFSFFFLEYRSSDPGMGSAPLSFLGCFLFVSAYIPHYFISFDCCLPFLHLCFSFAVCRIRFLALVFIPELFSAVSRAAAFLAQPAERRFYVVSSLVCF